MRSRAWIGAALLIVAVWVAGAGPLGAFLGKLGEVQTNDPSAFLPVDSESTEVDEAAEKFEQEETTPALVAFSADRELAGIESLSDELADASWTGGPVVGPLPGTEDPSVAQLVVPLDNGVGEQETVEEMRSWLDANTPDGLQAEVTGPAGFAADLVAAFGGIDTTLLLVAVGAVLVILIGVYRSPVLPLLVILTSLLALGLSGALVHFAASQDWVGLNGQSQGILFILVVGACTDYALLLVARYREELSAGRPVPNAVLASVRGVLGPVMASGGTVVLFDHVLELPGADPVVPLFAFVFLVALGIDYSIFLMSRAREETLIHGHREGVLRALTVTGGVITSAGVVLAATFAALAVIPLLFLLCHWTWDRACGGRDGPDGPGITADRPATPRRQQRSCGPAPTAATAPRPPTPPPAHPWWRW